MDDTKAQRLKAALRDNLRRRKRAARPEPDGKVPDDTDVTKPVRQNGNDEGA